jgi:hypothetical protein
LKGAFHFTIFVFVFLEQTFGPELGSFEFNPIFFESAQQNKSNLDKERQRATKDDYRLHCVMGACRPCAKARVEARFLFNGWSLEPTMDLKPCPEPLDNGDEQKRNPQNHTVVVTTSCRRRCRLVVFVSSLLCHRRRRRRRRRSSFP